MKYFHLIIIAFTLCSNTFGQINVPGTPASFNTNNSNSYRIGNITPIPSKEFPVMDTSELAAIIKKASVKKNISRSDVYSYIKDISINVLSEGLSNIQDGIKIWQYAIKAKNAKGIQIYFSAFKIPAGGKLYVYNKDRSMILGAYTDANNIDGGGYMLQPILGEEIIIEYNAPLNVSQSMIEIGQIGYVFNHIERHGIYSPGGSENCEHDVASGYGQNWEKEIRSVACVLLTDDEDGLGYLGSGALLNNSFQDIKPYFLTSKHVIDGINPSKIIFLFNYQNIISGVDTPLSTTQTISGCTVLSQQGSITSSDYALLLLSELLPAAYQACYAGWDYVEAAGQFSSYFKGIHHPRGDVKKISITMSPIISERADYTGPENNFWRVMWYDGITENGSSGSPLFNDQHKIVGHLHGGYSDCNTNGPDWYGKFSNSWNDGAFAYFLKTTPLQQLTSINTYCPVYNAQCINGIKDANETRIDCGGPLCPACKPTCTDGIRNGTEIAIDCGGTCPACPPTCSDGIRNQGEIQIDCGGNQCSPCPVPSCSDNWQNQNETGIDCGGVCQPCINLCSDGILNGDETDIDCGGSCFTCEGIIKIDAFTNGGFEYDSCVEPFSMSSYANNKLYRAFHSDTKCIVGNWYSSHGPPSLSKWYKSEPVNNSLAMFAENTYGVSVGSGIFYQLPINLDPTATYKLSYKVRYYQAPPVHSVEFFVTSGLMPSTAVKNPTNTPIGLAECTVPTYPFDKYRIYQSAGWSEQSIQNISWRNTSFIFTVPSTQFNQLWINAKNLYNNYNLHPSLVYYDDFVLSVVTPGISCTSENVTFNTSITSVKVETSILINGIINISPNASINLMAGNNITFKPGFRATTGSKLTAKIGSCETVERNNHISFSNIDSLSNSYLHNSINIFPNPTAGKFTLQASEYPIDVIEVWSIYGTLILKESYSNSENEIAIDLSDQQSGTYIIHIYSGLDTHTKKIILVR